ncbi:phage regulatory CII family protein [Desulfopila aestuarii]|uniref:Phage regulatory protein CII (CP76) n=1 Tax=Desulfopila aestuarii DSM 18488 TaxID=1121416 RepID=A0A1M7YJW1_9BACT|nr:phage regulatory CII family protein [Desulfopila aestuarii]SHO52887.1 hypothetical protein SAMN02745220_04821 [Desulfopila aestuarii DSM 18488]
MIAKDMKLPRSYEVMAAVLQHGDAVELARLLSCSPQLIRSWCRAPETEDEFSTGKFGPLDRLRTIIGMVREDDGIPDRAYPIGRYVAGLLCGVFVPMPQVAVEPDAQVMQRVSEVMLETGEAIEATRKAWFDNTPGEITNRERSICVAEIDDAIGSLVQLRRWIESKALISR